MMTLSVVRKQWAVWGAMNISLFLLAVSAVGPSWGTEIVNDRVFLVAMDVGTGEYFVERTAIIACLGPQKGARLAQWTQPYLVSSQVGCGEAAGPTDLNALSCAKRMSMEESADHTTYSRITLDISGCPNKEDKTKGGFIEMIRKSAQLNFGKKTKVDLID